MTSPSFIRVTVGSVTYEMVSTWSGGVKFKDTTHPKVLPKSFAEFVKELSKQQSSFSPARLEKRVIELYQARQAADKIKATGTLLSMIRKVVSFFGTLHVGGSWFYQPTTDLETMSRSAMKEIVHKIDKLLLVTDLSKCRFVCSIRKLPKEAGRDQQSICILQEGQENPLLIFEDGTLKEGNKSIIPGELLASNMERIEEEINFQSLRVFLDPTHVEQRKIFLQRTASSSVATLGSFQNPCKRTFNKVEYAIWFDGKGAMCVQPSSVPPAAMLQIGQFQSTGCFPVHYAGQTINMSSSQWNKAQPLYEAAIKLSSEFIHWYSTRVSAQSSRNQEVSPSPAPSSLVQNSSAPPFPSSADPRLHQEADIPPSLTSPTAFLPANEDDEVHSSSSSSSEVQRFEFQPPAGFKKEDLKKEITFPDAPAVFTIQEPQQVQVNTALEAACGLIKAARHLASNASPLDSVGVFLDGVGRFIQAKGQIIPVLANQPPFRVLEIAEYQALLHALARTDFFKMYSQHPDHEAIAQACCHQAFGYFGYSICFPGPGVVPQQYSEIGSGQRVVLDSEVFKTGYSGNSETVLLQTSKREDEIHILVAASQFNGGEAPSTYTIAVGEAMIDSQADRRVTQGPAVQCTNPIIFETITAFYSNLNGSMLSSVLPNHIKSADDGYLLPTNMNVIDIEKEFRANREQLRCICYTSYGKNLYWGEASNSSTSASSEFGIIDNKPNLSVWPFLMAATATGYATVGRCMPLDHLEEEVLFVDFLTVFRMAIDAAKQDSSKKVFVRLTGVGLGAFQNKTENFIAALQRAAGATQDEMKTQHITVAFDSYGGDTSGIGLVANALNITGAYPRPPT